MDYLDRLSRFAATLDITRLPDALREQLGWILADTIAAIAGGSAEPELLSLAGRLDDTGPATLIGLGRGASTDVAALVNGTAGTFLEMDEGNRFSRGHPAIHVIPAALALAQQSGADAAAFLSGIVAGYEVGSRIGAAARLRGTMHPHGTWGTLGAAAACARVAGQSPAGMHTAINVSASLTTATSKRTMLEGGLVRNTYAGMANRNGLLAHQLASSGFTGERDGVATLMRDIISDQFDTEAVAAGLGDEWHLMQNYFKLHSCCRFNHGTLDALDLLAARGALPPAEQISTVAVTSYAYAAELDDRAPHNTLGAKFSVPFAVATRIVNGSSGLRSFSLAAVQDPRVRALAARVRIAEDPAMTLRLPLERPANVVITCHDGTSVQAAVGANRGDDALPYSRDELRGKFLDLTTRIWPADHAQRLLQATLDLAQDGAPLDPWVTLLARPPKR